MIATDKTSQRTAEHAFFSASSDTGSQKGELVQFRSKHMTAEEIESILKMQHSSTHSNDPYVDDYYHQACLTKRSSLGSADGGSEQKTEKPLEQEPMLAARITIEDALGLLFDVDDIDRLIQFKQYQDGGAQLKRRRQILLEGLAQSLQLVDPLSKGGHAWHDHFPHLRFLFGGLSSDPKQRRQLLTLQRLFLRVSMAWIHALSACLVAVVVPQSSHHLGHLEALLGMVSSVILKSVLERASQVLSHPCGNCSMPSLHSSFDEFFTLLTKYCVSKFESIMQSIHNQSPPTTEAIGSEAISHEMPCELLRASLPHTNEGQRKLLMDFSKRSVPDNGSNSPAGSNSQIGSESVKG
ncbi:Topoisomerase II-associated protein PAT1, putative isoform 2 [Hibiscus syriacus]|uniref:Topoisomerase II-associated protein PAT1, putative isoform 2 n=1 Tax=Hibiscus syriacus TaxID=106335 RepID=A0A6A2YYH7_HIBSY|nr:Topoisomerase II-associated protein PAT1, putative isoform 2 [Hibiscus syriacus]